MSARSPHRIEYHLAISLLLLLAGAIRLHAADLANSPTDLLQRFDSNHDGRVTLYEYQRYLSRGFEAMDRNHDGIVAAEELPDGTRYAPAIETATR